MKKLNLSFRAHLFGQMEFEVADDLSLAGKPANEIWDELCENYPDQIEIDILNDDFPDMWGVELGGFTIDSLEFDSIESLTIEDHEGKTVEAEDYIDNYPLNLKKHQ